jgi:Uncharacterized low-complexity proteins
MDYFSEQKFTKLDTNKIPKADYDNCVFKECNFANQDLSDYKFSDCDFKDCDFSNVKINQTAFRDVVFKNCKLIGINFEDAHQFNISFRFENCLMNHSSFYQLDIRKTMFKNCSLNEADFTETNLSSSVFTDSDLTNAIFDRTILDNSDFRDAINFSIDPNQNQLKKTKFSKDNLSGLLDGLNIIIE